MGLGIRWKEVESQTVTNSTNLAAGSIEVEIASTQNVDFYNRITVVNLDTVNINVFLDNNSTRAFFVQSNGGILIIDPNDGIYFKSVSQKNLDGSTAETSGKIQFRVAKAVDVSIVNFDNIGSGARKYGVFI